MILNLFKPKWKHTDAEVRRRAVENLSGEEELSYVAQNDPDDSIRKIAIGKITNLPFLEKK